MCVPVLRVQSCVKLGALFWLRRSKESKCKQRPRLDSWGHLVNYIGLSSLLSTVFSIQ